jgi:hypothetical protein
VNKFHFHLNLFLQIFAPIHCLGICFEICTQTCDTQFFCSVACSFIAHEVIVFNKNCWRGKLWKFILTTFIETKKILRIILWKIKPNCQDIGRGEKNCFTRLCKSNKIELVLVFRPSNCKTMKTDSSSSVSSMWWLLLPTGHHKVCPGFFVLKKQYPLS